MQFEPPSPTVVTDDRNYCVVCVPSDWTDDQILEWVKELEPATSSKWKLTRVSSGDPVPCHLRDGYIHTTVVKF